MIAAHIAKISRLGTWNPIMPNRVLVKIVNPVIPAVPINKYAQTRHHPEMLPAVVPSPITV
jgi:hypothetical protein